MTVHPTPRLYRYVGGPLDGNAPMLATTRDGRIADRTRIGLTVDVTVKGTRAVYVWSPADEAFICRYQEDVA